MGRQTLADLGLGPRLQLHVAFEAAAEGSVPGQLQLAHDLAQLVVDPVAAEKDSGERAAGHHPPLHQAAVAGEQHPALGEGAPDQLAVVDVGCVGGVVAVRAEPAGETADVGIGEEPGHRPRL